MTSRPMSHKHARIPLSHLHGPQLCCESAAHSASKDDGCHYRRQLTDQCKSQHTTHAPRQAQLCKLTHKLNANGEGGSTTQAQSRMRV